MSGHDSGVIRVWNVATGVCDWVLQGHTGGVRCLAVSGTRLVSGSYDRSVKVWGLGTGAAWPCERTLVGHAGWVYALATWQGKVLSGSGDKSVRVWDVGTGAHEGASDCGGVRAGEPRVCSVSVDERMQARQRVGGP